MRKTILLSISMLTGAFAFANNGNGDTNNSETKTTQTQTHNQTQTVVIQTTSEEKTGDEALYCKVKTDNGEASCWFCDCEKLAKALNDNNKVKVSK